MFASKKEFSLFINNLKEEKGFDSYIDTLIFFIEETEEMFDYDSIASLLTQDIVLQLSNEYEALNLFKD